MITMPITMVDDDGLETTVNLPAAYHICAHCRGTGKSSSYLGAFSRDEMDEQGPEFVDDYIAGHYDRPCDDCQGTGKVLLIDEARCTSDEHKKALAWVRDQQEQMAECDAIVRAEMARGA